jgi:hypothetical protein
MLTFDRVGSVEIISGEFKQGFAVVTKHGGDYTIETNGTVRNTTGSAVDSWWSDLKTQLASDSVCTALSAFSQLKPITVEVAEFSDETQAFLADHRNRTSRDIARDVEEALQPVIGGAR